MEINEKTIRDIIRSELEPIIRENFRKWRSFDSVTDQYSPVTGASQQIGFYGTPKIAKQTVTGSRGGNAALASLLTKLAALGLITDSSS
jgi:hypothetical protein